MVADRRSEIGAKAFAAVFIQATAYFGDIEKDPFADLAVRDQAVRLKILEPAQGRP